MKSHCIRHMIVCLAAIVLATPLPLWAAPTARVSDVMDDVVTRMYAELDLEALRGLTQEEIWSYISPEQKEVLATRHWSFTVNVPVIVSVMHQNQQAVLPFWLEEQDWQKTDMITRNEYDTYEVFQKAFPAGEVGLGINGFDKHSKHYFVCVAPQDPMDTLEITDLFPAEFPVGTMEVGAMTYNDWTELVQEEVPAALEGHTLLTTIRGRAGEAHLLGGFKVTPHPSSKRPDQIRLCWKNDPRTSQTVLWRTNTEITDGAVRFWFKDLPYGLFEIDAKRTLNEDRMLANDRFVHYYEADLDSLLPGQTVMYQVGSPSQDIWSEPTAFKTAPAGPDPFSFIVFGDVHRQDSWARLLDKTLVRHPETAFYCIAGDLVASGSNRVDWDEFSECAKDVFNRRPVAPSIGNHDNHGGLGPQRYLEYFALPEAGPAALTPERAYAFEYSNTLVIALDSTAEKEIQVAWLEETLKNSTATWKIVHFHFPPYDLEEDYPIIREQWGALFDQYHVDMVFSGHVHHYMRSYPMFDQKKKNAPEDGTIYVVSIGIPGRDHGRDTPDFAELFIEGVQFYQTLDVEGNTLTYRARNALGDVIDELIIEK